MADDNIVETKLGDSENHYVKTSGDMTEATGTDERLVALGYKPQFRREMSLFGVLGISFCAIGIHAILFYLAAKYANQKMNE
jgi:hypothetical protein